MIPLLRLVVVIVGNVFLAHIVNLNTNYQVSLECDGQFDYDNMHPFMTTVYLFILAISRIIMHHVIKHMSSQTGSVNTEHLGDVEEQ